MTFKQFLKLDELEGQYGSPKAHHGPLGLIQAQAKMIRPVRGKGSSVSRMWNAGGGVSPSRPAKITKVNGPMTSPTLLKP